MSKARQRLLLAALAALVATCAASTHIRRQPRRPSHMAQPVPQVQLVPCASVNTSTPSTLAHGGAFVLNVSGSDPGPAGSCDVAAALAQTSSPWCLARMGGDDETVVLHTAAWTRSQHLGSWWRLQSSPDGSFALAQSVQAGNAAAPASGAAHNCLTGVAATREVLLTLCDPASANGSQAWQTLGSEPVLLQLASSAGPAQSSSPSGLCLGWASPSPPSPPPPPPPPSPGTFVVDLSPAGRRQIVAGVEVELMSDSIGSDNQGMPATIGGVPHELTASERLRFASEVMTGVRFIRLAMGLFLRGLTADGRNIVGRWPTQMAELRALQQQAGFEGWAPEYWSPPPAWKSTQSYYDGTLLSFNASFLEAFADSVVRDLEYLTANGLPVSWFGLQNEPNYLRGNITHCDSPEDAEEEEDGAAASIQSHDYSRCSYTQCQYYTAFMAVAARVRQWNATVKIHAQSATGQYGASPVANSAAGRALVDGWTWHHVDGDARVLFGNSTPDASHTFGIPSFVNEFEYQPGSPFSGTAAGTINTVNMHLNSLVFAYPNINHTQANAVPSVLMLHAAKPITNAESLGYGWTWYRPANFTNTTVFPELAPGHFEPNWWNYPAVMPFVKLLPWNARRVNVMEDTQRPDQRVAAFLTPATGSGGPLHRATPANKLRVVLTNAHPASPFNVTVGFSDRTLRSFSGYRFFGSTDDRGYNISLGTRQAVSAITTSLLPSSIEWWVEE